MSLTIDTTLEQIKALNSDAVKQNPADLALLLQRFVAEGSQLHVLNINEINVFANPTGDFSGVEKTDVTKIGDNEVSNTLIGLLAAGTKFFDAIIYLSLQADKRPAPMVHKTPKNGTNTTKYPLYNDLVKITQYIFVVYFYILIRAHPPSETGDYKSQPVPKFISTVLGIDATAGAVAEYLSSFPLEHLNPAWAKHIQISGIGQEAVSRLGLGCAGYRLVSVFNSYPPDKYKTTKKGATEIEAEKDRLPLENKPDWLDGSIDIAKSFIKAGMCWDFHPATRSPNVLSKYGNINKNANNLIIEAYTEKTIDQMMKIKKLAVKPVMDKSHTQYMAWATPMQYSATNKIFNQ